ncbi:MAG: hypothetical protein ACXADY_19785 [Candidatus Hodarchaeales archaeon]|jgi:predicted transcriptional regulator
MENPSKKKFEKINMLTEKINQSELDVKSIDFLSKITDEVSKYQDSVGVYEKSFVKHPISFASLSEKLRNLEHGRITLQTKIQNRRPVCSIISTNETIITTNMGNFEVFLNEFTATVQAAGGFAGTLSDHLKANDEFNILLEQYLYLDQNKDETKDVMQRLFGIFCQSIEEINQDKEYFLRKLKEMNDIAEAITDYLKYLTDIFTDTDDEDKEDETSNKGMIGYANIKLKKASTSLQGALNMIGVVVKEREEREERRRAYITAFENFDQKANQLLNLLSTVMKSTKEMQTAVSRNLL